MLHRFFIAVLLMTITSGCAYRAIESASAPYPVEKLASALDPFLLAEGYARKLVVEVDDGFLLRLFEPVVSWDEGVVLVDFSVASFPIVELSEPQSDPGDDSLDGQLRVPGPTLDVVDDLVSGIVEARTAADRTGRKQGGPR